MNQINIKLPDWEMNVYKVTGINPETNRKKSVEVIVLGSDEKQAEHKSGLINVSAIEKIDPEPPSQAQIKYGNDLGIAYKDYYSKKDYSCLISVATAEEEYIPIDCKAAEFAANHDIFLSQYASLARLYRYYYANLTIKEAAAFFAFTVYQSLYGFVCYDYKEHPEYELFSNFSDDVIDDEKFTNSLLRYNDINEFIPEHGQIRKSTNAYKICIEYFSKNGKYNNVNNEANVMSVAHKEKKESHQLNDNQIRCENCGEVNSSSYVYCQYCHSMLFRNIKCEKCGAENSAKNIYCDKCNHQLQPDPNIEKAKENNKNNFKIGVVALAIVACALIAFIIFLSKCS